MKKAALMIFVLLAVLCIGSAVSASVPPMINYQGKLTTPTGTPIADGTYSMQFAIYDVPTGGTALWRETNPSVQVKAGLFAVMLGSVTNLPANIFDSPDRFFGIKVGSESEMTPRQRIASVAYAQIAGTVVDEAITTNKIADGAVKSVNIAMDSESLNKISNGAMFTKNGLVGIGIADPSTTLQVAGDIWASSYYFTRSNGDMAAMFKTAVAAPNQHMHFIADYARQSGATDVSAFFGFNSEINNYNFFSKYGGVNRQLVGIGANPDYLRVNGDFIATGSKSAVVDTADYGKRLLYAVEAPDNRFTDEGIATLQSGTARIQLDPIFLQTIEDEFAIQVTPYGEAILFVAEVGKDYFVVKAHPGGQDVKFAWRLSAYRKGYAGVRLAPVNQ